MARSLMVRRIEKHNLFDGVSLISNLEVVRRINTIKRKKIGHTNNSSLERWMMALGFRRKWIGPSSGRMRMYWKREE